MKKILSIFVFTVSISMVMSQNSQSILYGIWEGRISSDPNSTQIYYNLINQPQLLSITTDRGKIIALGENFVGFASNQKDTLSLNELKNKGIFFCICSKQDTLFLCDYPKFNIFDSTYFTNGTDVFDYDKIQSLPMDMQRQLLQLSKIKKTNYFKIYLNKEMKLVKVKSFIYKLPNQPATKQYLIKDDVVEILEQKDNWLKIRYYGKKTIEGWIKKSDVE